MNELKKFKVRMQCVSFQDLVIEAKNKKEARELAEHYGRTSACGDAEFCEFLPVEEGDEISLCTQCHCMTKTFMKDRSNSGGSLLPHCGKCKKVKTK